MAKPLVFKIASNEYDLEPLKLDRKKLYGSSEKVALDNNDNECSAVSLYLELSMILPKGSTALGTIDPSGNWVEKSDLKYINVDEETKLITKYSITSAAPHDSTEIENIIDETDNRLHADSAYRSKEIEEYLKANECESFVHEKGYRGNPLTDTQKESNNKKSKIRARVEHIFGFMTNSMNNALYMRSIGMKRIKESIGLLNLTYNLFRLEQLIKLGKVEI